MIKFEEYLKKGFVKRVTKDEARARNVIIGAEKRKMIMEKYLPLNEETTTQIVEECYDVIRELLEAKLSRDGYKSYNHEAVISYMEKLGFSKEEIVFTDKLREVRHKLKYYGSETSLEYAKNVKDFLNKIYPKLKRIASQ